MSKQPTAKSVKASLQAALTGVESGDVSVDRANSVASIARAICRVVRIELEMHRQLVRPVSPETAAFVS